MSLTWAVFEILGTVAFAFSEAAVGLARGMDVFGIALLSVVTAVGGGILRDVLAGIFPPFALRGPDGIIFALMTAAAVCIGFRHFHIPRRGRKLVLFAYRVSDTAGLAAFTVTGAMAAIDSYPGYRYVLPVLLGLITAVGGGILRDVLAQKVPVVLYEDVYAMASVLGGIVICVLYPLTGIVYAPWGGFGAVLLLRICAIMSRPRASCGMSALRCCPLPSPVCCSSAIARRSSSHCLSRLRF